VDSLAHGNQRIRAEHLAEFIPVVDYHEVEIERDRAVCRIDDGSACAIRFDGMGSAVCVPPRVEGRTVYDNVFSSRKITPPVELGSGHSNECCLRWEAGDI
jgi:hypothetical protein